MCVVLRQGEQAIGERLQQQSRQQSTKQRGELQLVYAADAALGMGHSPTSGATALLRSADTADYAYFFVALADMPYVRAQTLAVLLKAAAADEYTILQPQYNQQPGNPVLFAMEHAKALTALQGDQGARAFIRHHAKQRLLVDVDDPGVLKDIDRPSDIN